jgi:hypothetical protein
MWCQLVAATTDGNFLIGQEAGCGPWDDEDVRVETATIEDVIPGGDPELVVRFLTQRHDLPLSLMVCRVAFKAVQCTKPYEIETSTYKVEVRFLKGRMILDPVEGKPPADLSGPQSLNFDH